MNEDLDTLTRAAALAYASGRASRTDLILCIQAGDRLASALQSLTARVRELEAKFEPKPDEGQEQAEPHLSALRDHPGKKKPAAKS